MTDTRHTTLYFQDPHLDRRHLTKSAPRLTSAILRPADDMKTAQGCLGRVRPNCITLDSTLYAYLVELLKLSAVRSGARRQMPEAGEVNTVGCIRVYDNL
jgi:hypothetical protein